MPDRVKPSFVISDIRTLTHRAERQSARISKITNDGLTWSGTGHFIGVPIWQVVVCCFLLCSGNNDFMKTVLRPPLYSIHHHHHHKYQS